MKIFIFVRMPSVLSHSMVSHNPNKVFQPVLSHRKTSTDGTLGFNVEFVGIYSMKAIP